jgi:D-alanyl-lipoteichoic acid acyltransferase DltB (MBOAT superfamily)
MVFVPQYILVLFFIIVVDFICALWMEQTEGAVRRRLFFVGLMSNIGVLFVFKYFNFFNDNIAFIAQTLNWNYSIETLSILLPLGLSFHTFQSISYLIEVYRGKYPAERHLGIYALYVMFFPQLVAGPIERPAHLLPQFRKVVSFESGNVFSGIRLMAWGFFKKMVIADRLAFSVNYVYANILNLSGPSILFAMFAFAFQLYADFSGYTDIARGSARVLGIELVRNFNQPYFSRSVEEFWRRWHISLSSWFHDYFYFPMAYSAKRITAFWLYVCILTTFVVIGLWHGAAWTYVVMGVWFGCIIVLGRFTRSARRKVVGWVGLMHVPRLHVVVQIISTFVLVNIGWVFFRSPDVATSVSFFGRLLIGWNISFTQFVEGYVMYPFMTLGIRNIDLILSFIFILILLLVENMEKQKRLDSFLDIRSLFVRTVLYCSLFFTILMFGVFTTNAFIYFQF